MGWGGGYMRFGYPELQPASAKTPALALTSAKGPTQALAAAKSPAQSRASAKARARALALASLQEFKVRKTRAKLCWYRSRYPAEVPALLKNNF